jgi:hypothetical protein
VIIVNFSHPINEKQRQQIEALTSQTIDVVYDIPCQLEQDKDFAPQVASIVEKVPLTPGMWQSSPILVNLPGLNYAAALLLAELHGRTGYFPACLRIRPVEGSVPVQFEVAEILNLEAIRQEARKKRFMVDG